MLNKSRIQTIVGLCIMFLIPVITFFWANKDFFRYYYKFSSCDVIEAEVPASSYFGRKPLFDIKLEFQYKDKNYSQRFPRKIFENEGDITTLHVIINPLYPEEPVFVRDFIIPHIFFFVLIFIIFFPIMYFGLPALHNYRHKT